MKASVARKALGEGAEIVNDVSAMGSDEAMVKVVADAGAAVQRLNAQGIRTVLLSGDSVQAAPSLP